MGEPNDKRKTHRPFGSGTILSDVCRISPKSSNCFIPALCQKTERIPLVEFYSGQQPDSLAASVVDYCTGDLRN